MELTEKQKQARREYQRQWRKNNPDKVKKHQAKFYNKIAKQIEEEEKERTEINE